MRARSTKLLFWSALLIVLIAPVGLSLLSPQLQWRSYVYIFAGLAGVIGLSLLLFQPILAGRYLPAMSRRVELRLHRIVGFTLVPLIAIHVGGLWLTSPPDVVDAFLWRSPTAFTPWGVAAFWAVFVTAFISAFRRKIMSKGMRLRTWRRWHVALALTAVVGTVVHAVLIDGTMEFYSKIAISALLVVVTLRVAMTHLKTAPSGNRK